jgi:RNA 2',3'-cyclic 3'-phosphodiesterase
MEKWRCFVAVSVPAPLRASLAGAVSRWRAEVDAPNLRWTDPDGWHVTLAFLGWQDSSFVAALLDAIRTPVAAAAPMTFEGGALGAFPTARRARVVWYGISDPGDRLASLATAVRSALMPLVPRVADESEFRAHLTLARARDDRGANLSGWLEGHSAPAGRLPVDRVVLYRSHLGGHGPARYEELKSLTLGERVGAEVSVHG